MNRQEAGESRLTKDNQPRTRCSFASTAGTAALLSALFLIVYGGCNWLTAQRTDVGTWYFNWERQLPFVPLLILPYMSIDLFFLGAPFLCRDDQQRRILAQRIAFAIVVAAVFFLAMPLRFAFGRPEAEGWVGAFFDAFRMLDQPYNLFPSLHITLCLILADLYLRSTHGLLRAALFVWFCLIGISTVLTYQHHVIDVIGGMALAVVCFYLFRDAPMVLPVVLNWRVGSYYGLGAVALLAAAFFAWPWTGLLLWPVLTLGIVATAYFGVGPGIYHKWDGRLPITTQLILAPVLLGQHLSLRYYRRQANAWDEVIPGVWLGRVLNDAEAENAVRQGVTAVLDLTGEFSEASAFFAIPYLNLPILDLTAPPQDQLQAAAEFIATNSATGTVYVHCKAGYSRSGAAVGAYLLHSGLAETAEAAIARLRQARPAIVIRPEAAQALHIFQRQKIAKLTATLAEVLR